MIAACPRLLILAAVPALLAAAPPSNQPPSGLTPTFTTQAPPGMLDTSIAPSPLLPGPANDFTATLAHTNGYITTGIGTGGGAMVDAGVSVPVLPGRVTIQAGAGTGQVPAYAPGVKSGRTALLRYNQYHAEIDATLGDNASLSLGIAGTSLTPPR